MGLLRAESNVAGHLLGDVFDEATIDPQLVDVLLRSDPPGLTRVPDDTPPPPEPVGLMYRNTPPAPRAPGADPVAVAAPAEAAAVAAPQAGATTADGAPVDPDGDLAPAEADKPTRRR